MSLWGGMPVFALALLGTSMGGHPALTHDVAQHPGARSAGSPWSVVQAALLSAAPSPSATPSPTPTPGALTPTTPSPVLQQLGSGKWQTTVLVSGLGGTRCLNQPTDRSDYTLETTSPATASNATAVAPAGKSSATASSCEATLTFDGLGQVPGSATLLLRGSSPISLAVGRQSALLYYLAVPAIAGGAIALFLLALCMIFVQVYEEDGTKKTRARKWKHPISASGAWTLNDSWATNIATLVAVVATVLGVSSAASELFPGVDLGRFVILIDIAGALTGAVPLLFAVLYAGWTARNPGVTEDASLWLTATLQRRSTATLPRGTRLTLTEPRRSRNRLALLPPRSSILTLRDDSPVILRYGTRAVVPGTSKIALAHNVASAELVPGTVVMLPRDTRVIHANGHRPRLSEPTQARIPTCTQVSLVKGAVVTPLAADLVELSGDSPVRCVHLPLATEVILPGDVTAWLADDDTTAALPAGAAVKIPPSAVVILSDVDVTLPDGTQVDLASPIDVLKPDHGSATLDPGTSVTLAAPAEGHPVSPGVTGPHGATARLLAGGEQATLGSVTYGAGAEVWVPAGATMTVPWSATACASALASGSAQPARVNAGNAIQIPPGSQICVLGGWITLPGTCDVLVQGDSVLVIKNQLGALNIAGSGAPADGSQQSATSLKFPVRMTIHGGAKITVTGVAEIVRLPDPVPVTAPHRRNFELSRDRLPVRIPQATSTLVGPLWAVILAAFCTIFGVGAQLGIAGVLAIHFSNANTAGLWCAWIISIAVGLFTLWYSTTAIRALADPQPGSSMSSTTGTSFTL
jgi:hypothetical protein